MCAVLGCKVYIALAQALCIKDRATRGRVENVARTVREVQLVMLDPKWNLTFLQWWMQWSPPLLRGQVPFTVSGVTFCSPFSVPDKFDRKFNGAEDLKWECDHGFAVNGDYQKFGKECVTAFERLRAKPLVPELAVPGLNDSRPEAPL